jgi:hypothetical protein
LEVLAEAGLKPFFITVWSMVVCVTTALQKVPREGSQE